MYQAILVHSDVHKGAKVCDVCDHALEQHAWQQVIECLNAFFKGRGCELWSRITTGLFKLHQNVAYGGNTEAFIGKL